MRGIWIFSIIVLLSGAAMAQTPESLSMLHHLQDTTRRDSVRQDSIKQETPSSVPAGNDQITAPRNYYNLLRNKAVTRKGLFTVHKVDDNYYLEIPDSILGRDLLIVSRIAQGAA